MTNLQNNQWLEKTQKAALERGHRGQETSDVSLGALFFYAVRSSNRKKQPLWRNKSNPTLLEKGNKLLFLVAKEDC